MIPKIDSAGCAQLWGNLWDSTFSHQRADSEVTDPALYDEICGQAENHKTQRKGKVLTRLWEARVEFYSHFTCRLAHEG